MTTRGQPEAARTAATAEQRQVHSGVSERIDAPLLCHSLRRSRCVPRACNCAVAFAFSSVCFQRCSVAFFCRKKAAAETQHASTAKEERRAQRHAHAAYETEHKR